MFQNSNERRKDFTLLNPRRVIVYKSDVVIEYVGNGGGKRDPNSGARGEIKELTKKSLHRLAFIASNTCADLNTMLTLTYPREFPVDGKESKRHLNNMLTKMRKALGRFDYLWFMEFQKRGAPHYHLLFDCMGRKDLKDFVSSAWYECVGSGDKRHLAAGTRIETVRSRDGAKRYALKYAMKTKQKSVPPEYTKCGRFWGCSKSVIPVSVASMPVDSMDVVMTIVKDWQYKSVLVGKNISTLYNASECVDSELIRMFAKD